jgi:HAD superfamily hydrolase (TIGR01509 family)
MRGVLWDLDGVLVDSGEFHYRAWAETLARHRIPYSRDSFHATFGMNNLGTLAYLLGHPPSPELLSQINREKEESFRAAVREGQGRGPAVSPLPGVVRWLEHLKSLGMKQAIASSAPQANIDVLVDALDLRRHFDAIVSGAELPGKPDPAVFVEAARRLDLPTLCCVVIEDSPAGVLGAKRAGMRCVAITTTHPRPALHEADVIVDAFDALPEDVFRSEPAS